MDTESMERDVVVHRASGVHRIVIRGDIDQRSAAALPEALQDAAAEPPRGIEVDLAGATFFCCAGVAALQTASNATRGHLVLVDAGVPVRKVLTALNMAAAVVPAFAPHGRHR